MDSLNTDKTKVDVLLVDDRDDGLLALELVLDSPDYHLVKARSGHEALSLLPQHDFALILLDVQMPGIDGFETAKRLRADARYKTLPIIFVTAISKDLHYIYGGYGSGAVDYLFKPIDPLVLRSKVMIFADLYRKTQKVKEHARLLVENEKKSHLLALAEIQLENFRRYQNLADAVPHIIWKAKHDGTAVYFNRYWCEYTGLGAEENGDAAWRSAFFAADLAQLLELWKEAADKRTAVQTECRIRRHDGNYRWHQVQIVYEKSIEDQIISWIGACTDIHDRKEKEDQLKRRADEFARLNEELSRSNKELEQFAYVASHDLQEPLRMVSNYVDLLAMHYEGRLDTDADNYIKHACEGAIRAQQLIRDILAYARIGPKESRLVRGGFRQIVDKTLFNLKLAIEESGAEITCDELPEVTADQSQMMELIQNLVSNAIKFRSKDPLKIHISARKEDEKWIFSLKDNGIGIESQYQERIFDIFKRLHKKNEYPGTGIGLAICKKIVERHGGKIWVESETQKGSVFYFSIPCNLKPAAEKKESSLAGSA